MVVKPHISLIVAAMAPELGIGANGKLPWRLKQEIKYFRDVTSHSGEGSINAVIMGRKTWESIPAKFRPLPNRLNVILSHSHTNEYRDGVLFYNSMDSILDAFQRDNYKFQKQDINKIFIIGGAQIYNAFVTDPRVDSLLLTNITFTGEASETPVMDTFLRWNLDEWKRLDSSRLKNLVGVEFTEGLIEEGAYEYEYTLWERK
ncbi:hypothetical protein PUMCH_003524 [Australozyma saopauloensis]|uniref:Dihydrofolate reductase n=1 Tax=Australozyma saopauloensis TaxID=291208 RepID=A0AAX4HCQ3_9ASCO|nr:hypothetical protein PUMCH_003524 [[Candida] saopauloensis]